MRLSDYLRHCEYEATHVLIAGPPPPPTEGDNFLTKMGLREEVHPIKAEYLGIMRKVWTTTYYQWQAGESAKIKAATTEAKRHAAAARNATLRGMA